MAEELEGTSEFNRHHRLVTGEVPITVANSVVDMFQTDVCTKCGRAETIAGRPETVIMSPTGGFHHYICDERWDES